MLEQHPVPQNVTTFQFRLIGDMTLKQFAYLAGGAVLAYISYNLPLPFFFTYPLAAIFGLGGIGFAFVPIEERPMDVWFLSFIRSIYSPTQYIWQRQPVADPSTQTSQSQTVSPTMNLPVFKQISQLLDKIMPVPTPKTSTTATVKATPRAGVPPTAGPTVGVTPSIKPLVPPVVQKPVVSSTPVKKPVFSFPSFFKAKTQAKKATPAQVTEHRQFPPAIPSATQPAYIPAVYPSILTSKPLPSVDGVHPLTNEPVSKPDNGVNNSSLAGTTQPPPVHKPIIPTNTQQIQKDPIYEQFEKKLKDLEEQLQKEREEKKKYEEIQQQLVSALQEKQQLEKKLAQTQQTNQAQKAVTQVATQTPTVPSPTVKVISPQVAKSVGMPSMSQFPNVISGVVRERNGNLLVGILVTVKDKDDVPVRALKTNKLGQFAASTPLPNGNYILEAEDPKRQFSFDLAKLTLNGGLVPSIELLAKTQQDIERKKLEQSLFGKQT